MQLNPNTVLAQIDAQYARLQQYAKANGYEQLLAQAVVWSVNNETHDDLSEVERYQLARRAVAWQTVANQGEMAPEALWRALVGV